MKLQLTNVRLSFPDLFTPRAIDDGEPRYSAAFILPPDHPQLPEIRAALKQAAIDKWAARGAAQYAALEATDKLCLHNGSTKAYDGYDGNFFISAASPEDKPPLVLGPDRRPLEKSSGKPYAGCYVNAVVEIWAQDNKFGKRINASLKGVQFARDGDAFSGSPAATVDDFEDISEGATADDLV